ncbi:MAG TPA: hypothetical protein VJ302_37835 [Blastocatellia bacterium]|nr:hypothetical protein [Blastocatellia bacterium]
MYNSLKFVAWTAVLVITIGVGKHTVNGLRASSALPPPQPQVSQSLIRQTPSFPPFFTEEQVEQPSSPTEKPSDETVKTAILAVRLPSPVPEDGYEVNGVSNGAVEILRQSDFDEARQELRVAALITADVKERARQAPSPFDKFQVIRCKYTLVEYYWVRRDRSGYWTAHAPELTRNKPQMQCRY